MLEHLKLEISKVNKPASMPVKLVSIDGHGGAGKTTLAKKLAQILDAEILHTDDFASYDKPMDWWARLVDEIFIPIQNGVKTLNYRRGAWYKDHLPEPVKGQPVTEVMILEGVSSSRREFRKYLAYTIWVETPRSLCIERGTARDLVDNEAGKAKNEIVRDWEKWHKFEVEYFKKDQPKEYADMIVNGTKSTI